MTIDENIPSYLKTSNGIICLFLGTMKALKLIDLETFSTVCITLPREGWSNEEIIFIDGARASYVDSMRKRQGPPKT